MSQPQKPTHRLLVRAVTPVRKLRGGAQAHLILACDGNYYVVKFRNNPQHLRILLNEWIAAQLLRILGMAVADTAIVQLDEEFIRSHPDLYMQLGSQRYQPEPGWHFGSRYPVDPNQVAVYDFLPDALLPKVGNRLEFLGMLAFDKWTANADARQAVFYRPNIRHSFQALMIDHGYCFNGPHWQFADAPGQGLYSRSAVYTQLRTWQDLEPWLCRIMAMSEAEMDEIYRRLPPPWLDNNRDAVEQLLERLMRLRKRVPDLVEESLQAQPRLFPSWAPRLALSAVGALLLSVSAWWLCHHSERHLAPSLPPVGAPDRNVSSPEAN